MRLIRTVKILKIGTPKIQHIIYPSQYRPILKVPACSLSFILYKPLKDRHPLKTGHRQFFVGRSVTNVWGYPHKTGILPEGQRRPYNLQKVWKQGVHRLDRQSINWRGDNYACWKWLYNGLCNYSASLCCYDEWSRVSLFFVLILFF